MKLSDFGLCKPVDVSKLPPLHEDLPASSPQCVTTLLLTAIECHSRMAKDLTGHNCMAARPGHCVSHFTAQRECCFSISLPRQAYSTRVAGL